MPQITTDKQRAMAKKVITALQTGQTRKFGTVELPGFCARAGNRRIAMLCDGADVVLVYENVDGGLSYSTYVYQSTGPVAADVLDATGEPEK